MFIEFICKDESIVAVNQNKIDLITEHTDELIEVGENRYCTIHFEGSKKLDVKYTLKDILDYINQEGSHIDKDFKDEVLSSLELLCWIGSYYKKEITGSF